jgi:hypothetical protein
VFCRCPADEVERRFIDRAPRRHPGHVDHLLAPEMRAALALGVGPLRLGGPVLEVDTTRPVGVARIAAWVRARAGILASGPDRERQVPAGGQAPGGGPV